MRDHPTQRLFGCRLRTARAVDISYHGPSLRKGLVGAAAAVVLGAVGEEEIDDKADDGEDEDAQAPQQLGYGRAVGLEDLDCVGGGG